MRWEPEREFYRRGEVPFGFPRQIDFFVEGREGRKF